MVAYLTSGAISINEARFLATATTDLKPLKECISRKQQVENLKKNTLENWI